MSGDSLVTLHLHDDGGIAGGGDDTSPTQTFTISISSINHVPSFTKGIDQTDLEDAGLQSVTNWATAISQGAGDTGQTLTFVVDSNSNSGLFSSQPAVSPSGTLTYTPKANANGSASITLHLEDDGGTLNGGHDTSAGQTFTINVTPVNDAPSFTKGPDKTVSESSSAASFPGWATGISKGPADKSGDVLNFVIDSVSVDLFSVGPAVSPSGTLSFTPTPGVSGDSLVTLHLHDDGGIAGGGDDTSPTQTFTISISSINHVPSFTKGIDQTDLEDAGLQSVTNWATAISQGAGDTGQTLTFVVDSNSNSGLFSSQPAVSPSGTLTYTPKANANGSASITLHLEDDGGTLNGGHDTSAGQTFTINVTPVNDAPSFTKGANQTVPEDTGLHTVAGWAAAPVAGPPDEISQVFDYVIDSDSNPALFAIEPAVSASGVLTYTLAPNANGIANIDLHIHDSGGVLNGGIDAGPTVTLRITVTNVNDPPTCVGFSAFTTKDTVLTASIPSCVDIDGDTLSYALGAVSTSHGTVVVHANGSYTYTPASGYLGPDRSHSLPAMQAARLQRRLRP